MSSPVQSAAVPGADEVTSRLFVVERYDDTGTPGPLQPPTPPSDVHFAFAVRVPADDVVLALIEGPDEQTICAALVAAGWRVDRITPATWAQLPDRHPRTGRPWSRAAGRGAEPV